jgi:hypothetical protein
MKTVNVNKPYSWLQWPVRLKNLEKPGLHVTVKYFGEAAINPKYVGHALDNLPRIELTKFLSWRPECFDETLGIYVLELLHVPPAMIVAHQQFALIKDQFEPWRPHITVPLAYWDRVAKDGWTPQSEELTFDEIELCLGSSEYES